MPVAGLGWPNPRALTLSLAAGISQSAPHPLGQSWGTWPMQDSMVAFCSGINLVYCNYKFLAK